MKNFLIIGGIFGGCLVAFLLSYLYVSQSGVPASKQPTRPPIDIAALRVKAEHADAQAQADLGDAYANGDGVTNSYTEAAKWYRLAADQTNAAGLFGIGQLYEAGQGVRKDTAEAAKLYRQAAELGSAGAQYNLGFMYETGRGLPLDQAQAAKWMLLSAEQGEPVAQYDIGLRYFVGSGMATNKVEALKWLILATAHGQADASDKQAQVKKAMTRAQIGEAEKLAAAFSARHGLSAGN